MAGWSSRPGARRRRARERHGQVIMNEAATVKIPLLAGLVGREEAPADSAPGWLAPLRREALKRFAHLGIPTPRDEEWRSTNVGPIAETRFGAPAGPAPTELPPDLLLGDETTRLVFVDGRHVPELSRSPGLPDGAWIGTLRRGLEHMPERLRPLLALSGADDEVFEALNGAFLDDGAVIAVGEGVTLDTAVELVFLSGSPEGPTTSQPRTLVLAGRDSELQVVETYAGLGPHVYFTNAVSRAEVSDNARVDHYRVQLESEEAYHVSTVTSRQTRNSRYRGFNINLGGRLVRHNVHSVLDGEGSCCNLFGLGLTRHAQHVDNHTVLEHAKPHCDSRELYKSILDGRSRSVFKGRIIVRNEAQKTDSKQSNPNLLLSPDALAHTRPQLEIHADDVRCTHGATIGRMDEDAVFYMRSRGLPAAAAKNLLIQAFAGEVLEKIAIAPLRDRMERAIAARLAAR